MGKYITIRNIKHIKHLEFKIPSQRGVYLLTGNNGSGKTTLLACLMRIGHSRAFPDNFKPGNNTIDKYNGDITYTVNNTSVSYHYAQTRWPPSPRKNSKLFNQFGYPQVRFLPATGNRLFIQEEDIDTINFRTVEANLKRDMNRILETDKFTDLKYVQTGSNRGPGGGSQRWKRAYAIKNRRNCYSEKNFSLGEILILNTLLLIQDMPEGSMLLIDEIEMALHPRAQLRLLKYLEEKAAERNLTIMLSTHSSSLIKCARKLIYLENQGDGNILVKHNCYPAIVLREVAIEEDVQPDYIFLVEDDMAEMLLNETIRYYFQLETSRIPPLYKVIPIGGYQQVLEFAKKTNQYLFSSNIGQYIFLDNDVVQVKTDLSRKGNSRSASEQNLYELFDELKMIIDYLPITPELGIWEWLLDKNPTELHDLNAYYNLTANLKDLLQQTEEYFNCEPETDNGGARKKAKRRLKHLAKLLEANTSEDSKRIIQHLFNLYTKEYYIGDKENDLRATFSIIFNQRGNRLALT